MQLRPGQSIGPEKVRRILETKNLIGLTLDDRNKQSYNNFVRVMSHEDIVLIRDGKTPIALVEVVGDHIHSSQPDKDLDWFEERREIKVLDWAEGNQLGAFPQPQKTLEKLVNDTPSRTYVERWHTQIIGKTMIKYLLKLLESNKQVILTGAPGTGKTHLAREIAAELLNCTTGKLKDNEDRFGFVQFHPAYDYTDFVEGLKPVRSENNSKQIDFDLRPGIFKQFCETARKQGERPCVFVIDEINRADLSRVFGELFYALEPSYRGEDGRVLTQYASLRTEDDRFFYVPKNVYIIGTMNDIDRSVMSMDFALRRRFAWYEVQADEARFDTVMAGVLDESAELKQEAKNRYTRLNEAIANPESGLGNAYQIGPAYFRKLADYKTEQNIWTIFWERHLKLLIKEYVRGMSNEAERMTGLYNAFQLQPPPTSSA